jgi:hypothetical protein
MKTLRLLLICSCVVPALHAAKGDKKDNKKDKTPAAIFEAMDADHNGSITLAEYVAAQKERIGEDGAKKRFAELDKDHDGKLTREEMGATPDKASKGDRPRRKKKADAN